MDPNDGTTISGGGTINDAGSPEGAALAGSVADAAARAFSGTPHCGQNLKDRVPRSAPQEVQNMNYPSKNLFCCCLSGLFT
jgi:hypothetical protein